jgi:hypothetical protein
MAKTAGVEVLVGGVDPDLKKVFIRVFDYVLNNLRIGRPDAMTRSENVQAYFLTGTTPAVASTEFSIAHGLSQPPYVALPVLDLQQPGGQLPRLVVSRASDANRIYLKSADTNAPFTLLIEAP